MTLWSALVVDSEEDEETLNKYRDECGEDIAPDESEGWEEEDDLEQII